jgi:hypothetical protein
VGDAFQCCVDRAGIIEVRHDNRRRCAWQSSAILVRANHRTNAGTAALELLQQCGSGVSGGARDENQIFSVIQNSPGFFEVNRLQPRASRITWCRDC